MPDVRNPHRDEYTTCTAIAPDLVLCYGFTLFWIFQVAPSHTSISV